MKLLWTSLEPNTSVSKPIRHYRLNQFNQFSRIWLNTNQTYHYLLSNQIQKRTINHLHWLPILTHIQFTVPVLVHKSKPDIGRECDPSTWEKGPDGQ